MNKLPDRPPVPAVFVGRVYTYEGCGKIYRKKKVKVIATRWHGSSLESDSHLVHVQLIGKKGKLTDFTFGCDPRWLTDGGLSTYGRYHNELAKENKNIQEVKEREYLKSADEDYLDDDGMNGVDLFTEREGLAA
jgi:hypothetical protein